MRRAAFYPFAAYSPEWQALRYAVARGVPARFIDCRSRMQRDGGRGGVAAQLEAAQGAEKPAIRP
ncbi:MAG: DUF5682 family protein [Chloroflexia bacterium]